MEVLLLNPPFLPRYSRSSRSPAVTRSGTLYYPLWLAHAAGVLEREGHKVRLVDAPADGLTAEDVVQIARDFEPRLVVLDTSTPSIHSDVGMAAALKSAVGDALVCLVGTHPSALPEETLAMSPAVDAVARHEYDYTLRDLAAARECGADLSGVSGLSYRRGGEVVNNPDRQLIENLDAIPFVSETYRKHLCIEHYFYAHVSRPVISIFAGRGCPGRCTFCLYPQTMFGRRYRHRSATHLVDELEFISREMGQVREVLIDDDCFSADQQFVRQVCQEILRRGLRTTWSVQVRVNLNYQTMLLMRQAGCRLVVAGFESGNQQILDNIRKGTTVERARAFMAEARQARLQVHGCFMAGNPGETPETLKDTLNLALELDPDLAQFFPLMVYPGTEAYRWAEENGYLVTRDFSQWLTADGCHRALVSTPELSAEQVEEFCRAARRRFYLRPRFLARSLWRAVRSRDERSHLVRGARAFVRHLLPRSPRMEVAK